MCCTTYALASVVDCCIPFSICNWRVCAVLQQRVDHVFASCSVGPCPVGQRGVALWILGLNINIYIYVCKSATSLGFCGRPALCKDCVESALSAFLEHAPPLPFAVPLLGNRVCVVLVESYIYICTIRDKTFQTFQRAMQRSQHQWSPTSLWVSVFNLERIGLDHSFYWTIFSNRPDGHLHTLVCVGCWDFILFLLETQQPGVGGGVFSCTPQAKPWAFFSRVGRGQAVGTEMNIAIRYRDKNKLYFVIYYMYSVWTQVQA